MARGAYRGYDVATPRILTDDQGDLMNHMPTTSHTHAGTPISPLSALPHLDPKLMPPGGGMQRYREMTIDDMLLENRVVFLVGEINYSSATSLIMRLLYLSNMNKADDIHLYINSPGGAVDDTLAIYDTMKYVACDVATYCIGKAMSGGAITLAAGTPGKRFILPHAKVMIHQPYGGVYGQAADVKIQAEEIIKSKNLLNEMLANMTGQSVDRVAEDAERDKYFSATEAKDYGLVDEVLEVAKPENTAPPEA